MAKKIKKVETPIDQHETFVSLQKNFADSELSVQEKLKTLYNLQEADSAIDKILQLRGELPNEVEVLENDITDVTAKITQLTAITEEFEKSISDNKKEIVEYDAQIVKYKKQLENISNSREYDSINKEIENEELLRQIAEKNIVDIKNAIAEKNEEIEELKNKLSIREDDLKAKKEELEHIVEATSKEEKKLQAVREACAAKIDERTMSAYERIRSNAHNHLAVVGIYNGDSCGGCFSNITAQRLVEIASNKKLIICEHCGRIIVNPDFEQ